MGNYFSEMNCIKGSVIKETNNDTYFDEVKKDENIPEEVKKPNPICDIQEGLAKKEAVLEAASQRLRPILMTSLATALGALPIALSLGAAATSRMPLGIVIVGGIFFSLFLTLFVVPAVYIFVSGKHIKAIEETA